MMVAWSEGECKDFRVTSLLGVSLGSQPMSDWFLAMFWVFLAMLSYFLLFGVICALLFKLSSEASFEFKAVAVSEDTVAVVLLLESLFCTAPFVVTVSVLPFSKTALSSEELLVKLSIATFISSISCWSWNACASFTFNSIL